MNFGLQIANLEFPRLRDVAQAAEALGFHAVYLPDHIVYEGPERQADPHHLAWDPMIEAAVIAEATRRIRIGHLVLCNLFRHPVITAQCLASLDHLSGGRVVAGLGSGWTETEFRMTGLPYPDITTRLRMLDEALACIRRLWSQEQTTFTGEFYQLRDAILWPKPLQQPHPPILLGGSGRGLLRIAARHADVVNIISDVGRAGYIRMSEAAAFTDEAFRARVQFVREEAARHGRDGDAIRMSNVVFTLILADSPAQSQAAAERMSAVFSTQPDAVRRSPMALIGTPEECVTELRRRANVWDVSEVVFSGVRDDAIRRLGEQVLPRV